jgi:branched-chain amino acid transport system permease protein
VSDRMPRASGYFRTDYAQEIALIKTRLERMSLIVLLALLLAFPFVASAFYLDLATQVFLASIGALALMLLTGFAGGLYLAVSTLALHFVVVYLGGEYETKRGFSTGITIDAPVIAGFRLYGGKVWYFILLAFAAASLLICANLLRSRSGRAWRAIRAHETVAAALGINVAAYKLLAFVISSAMAAVAGALFAYYRGFVSVEAFSLFLSIQYVAMIIIGGMGSLLGALLGAAFVTLFPYFIEAVMQRLPNAQAYADVLFAVNYAAFGVVMIGFLIFEPQGLVGIWRRIQNYFLLWPFKQKPIAGGRK